MNIYTYSAKNPIMTVYFHSEKIQALKWVPKISRPPGPMRAVPAFFQAAPSANEGNGKMIKVI
jgi:hypothetical protein